MLKQTEELKDRVQAKKSELEARISTLKADTRSSAREEIKRLQERLNEIQQSVAEGWDKLSDKTVEKLNTWLKN